MLVTAGDHHPMWKALAINPVGTDQHQWHAARRALLAQGRHPQATALQTNGQALQFLDPVFLHQPHDLFFLRAAHRVHQEHAVLVDVDFQVETAPVGRQRQPIGTAAAVPPDDATAIAPALWPRTSLFGGAALRVPNGAVVAARRACIQCAATRQVYSSHSTRVPLQWKRAPMLHGRP